MGYGQIKVLIIEDDKDETARIRDYLDLCADMAFVGETGSGPEGMELTRRLRPDVVILDLELTEGHGVYYMDAWMAGGLECRPIVLALTAVTSAYTLDMLRRRQVARTFYKESADYLRDGPAILVDFIRELTGDMRTAPRPEPGSADRRRGDIEVALSHVGGHMGNHSFAYVVESIFIVSGRPAGPVNFARDVYPQVCAKFHKTPGAVQRGISYCVAELYNKVDRAALEEAYRPELKESTNAAEAKQFIMYFANQFRDR